MTTTSLKPGNKCTRNSLWAPLANFIVTIKAIIGLSYFSLIAAWNEGADPGYSETRYKHKMRASERVNVRVVDSSEEILKIKLKAVMSMESMLHAL